MWNKGLMPTATVFITAMFAHVAGAEAKQCTTYVLERLGVAASLGTANSGKEYYGYVPGAASSTWDSKTNDKKRVYTFSGNASTWYDKAAAYPGGAAVSSTPKAGYIMVFAGSSDTKSGAGVAFPTTAKRSSSVGHVAYVAQGPVATTVSNQQYSEIKVDHANWSLAGAANGTVTTGASVISNDGWTTARVEYYSDGRRTDRNGTVKPVNYGNSSYAVKGFVNPSAMIRLKKK